MKQDYQNKESNTGCAIAVGIFVLANIIYFFATSSKQDVAGLGAFLLFIAFMTASYFGIKAYLQRTEDSDNKVVRIGVPIGIFIALMLLLGAIMSNFNTMVVIGSIGVIVLSVIIGILIYYSYKD